MRKINLGIVGFGNVGRGVLESIHQNPDTQLRAIITRSPDRVTNELGLPGDNPFVIGENREDLWSKANIDVAVLCGGSKNDLPKQGPHYARFFNTVDSFDTHADIPEYYAQMDSVARDSGKVTVIATGWDPGTYSLERVLADAFIPGVKPHAFYGGLAGGVSQGHSDAARQVEGVKDARQYTIWREEAMERIRRGENPDLTVGDRHTRLVFVVADEGMDQSRIAKEIRDMPKYFDEYETTVQFISEEEMKANHSKMPHSGVVMAAGTTGKGNKALIEYKCDWESNPEATGNILVAHARAAYRLNQEGVSGAKTILDIPAAYLSPRSKEEILRDFM